MRQRLFRYCQRRSWRYDAVNRYLLADIWMNLASLFDTGERP